MALELFVFALICVVIVASVGALIRFLIGRIV